MRKTFLLFVMAFCVKIAIGQVEPLKPTEDKALVNTVVTNEHDKPMVNEQVFFTSKKSGQKYSGVTNELGKFSILLPIADTYIVQYTNLTSKVKHNEITIPSEPALYTWDVSISFEPAKIIVLENVEYDFNKATIRPSSFNTLNDLYDAMLIKPNLVIEIGGHTDNVGDDKSNQLLSQRRAEAVKQYLVKKGIKADRIQIKGYGESMPIANNDTDEGRQKNRRTEVKVISE